MNENLVSLFCMGLVFVLLFVIGITSIISGIKNKRKASQSQNWQRAKGIITNAFVQESRSVDDEGDTTYTYTPSVEYQYQVGPYTYTSTRIAFGSNKSYNNRRNASKALEMFPIRSGVIVYYNPNDPNEATLQRTAKGVLGGFLVGILLLIISICLGFPWFITTALDQFK